MKGKVQLLLFSLLLRGIRPYGTRRVFISGAAVVTGTPVSAALVDTSMSPLGGIGAGTDLGSPSRAASTLDTIFPSSIAGEWRVERTITSVEGDAGQAEVVWRALGGKRSDDNRFARRTPEIYATRFVVPPDGVPNTYIFEGENLQGTVIDRAFELASRGDVTDVTSSATGRLVYGDGTSAVELVVVQRSSELPTAQGFGASNELIRITTTGGGGIFGRTERAARIQRRFRRSYDNDGTSRVIEGIELVKSYRVLDGVAGELPTSTTKSTLRLVRNSDVS